MKWLLLYKFSVGLLLLVGIHTAMADGPGAFKECYQCGPYGSSPMNLTCGALETELQEARKGEEEEKGKNPSAMVNDPTPQNLTHPGGQATCPHNSCIITVERTVVVSRRCGPQLKSNEFTCEKDANVTQSCVCAGPWCNRNVSFALMSNKNASVSGAFSPLAPSTTTALLISFAIVKYSSY